MLHLIFAVIYLQPFISYEFYIVLAFSLFKELCLLYNNISSNKKTTKDLYHLSMWEILAPAQTNTLTLLQELVLFADIISQLSLKSCSLAVVESSLNVAEKLANLLLEFVRDGEPRETVHSIEEIPECTWPSDVRLLCICVIQCTLWNVCICKGNFNMFSHRVDQSELVKKLLVILRVMKKSMWHDSWFRSSENDMDVVGYRLFLVYGALGFLVTLLKKSVCGEIASVSERELARKVYSKEQVQEFVKIAPDLLQFVCFSLNAILTTNISPECSALVKQKAENIISVTGQLISAVKKAVVLFEAELLKLRTPTDFLSSGSLPNINDHSQRYGFPSNNYEAESSSGSDDRTAREENQNHNFEGAF